MSRIVVVENFLYIVTTYTHMHLVLIKATFDINSLHAFIYCVCLKLMPVIVTVVPQ